MNGEHKTLIRQDRHSRPSLARSSLSSSHSLHHTLVTPRLTTSIRLTHPHHARVSLLGRSLLRPGHCRSSARTSSWRPKEAARVVAAWVVASWVVTAQDSPAPRSSGWPASSIATIVPVHLSHSHSHSLSSAVHESVQRRSAFRRRAFRWSAFWWSAFWWGAFWWGAFRRRSLQWRALSLAGSSGTASGPNLVQHG